MGTLTIPNVFTNLTQKANADDMNENFAEIAAKLNGNLDGDNISAIAEAKITFNPTTGHDHSGGSKGKPLEIAEDKIDFDFETGHDHDGSSSRLAALAKVNGVEGTVKVASGTKSVAKGDSEIIDISGYGFDNYLISLDVYWKMDESSMSNKYLGLMYEDRSAEEPEVPDYTGYYVSNVSKTAFTINNHLKPAAEGGEGDDPTEFYWRAIGV